MRQKASANGWVRIKERRNQGPKGVLYIGMADLRPFVIASAKAQDCEPSVKPYATFNSKMFEGKVFEFHVVENQFHRSLMLREHYTQGPQKGTSYRIYVNFDIHNKFMLKFREILTTDAVIELLDSVEEKS